MNILQDLPQAISKVLLPEIRKDTFSPVARAVVVSVFAPLNFRCNRAAVVVHGMVVFIVCVRVATGRTGTDLAAYERF